MSISPKDTICNESSFSKALINFQKNLTILLFYILPTRVTNVFVSLSILVFIHRIRNKYGKNEVIDINKFNFIMSYSFNESIMLLPEYTVNWFWTNEFLERTIIADNRLITLKEAMINDDILFKHLRTITNVFLQNLPDLFKLKLKLNNQLNSIIVKHNIMNMLIHV